MPVATVSFNTTSGGTGSVETTVGGATRLRRERIRNTSDVVDYALALKGEPDFHLPPNGGFVVL